MQSKDHQKWWSFFVIFSKNRVFISMENKTYIEPGRLIVCRPEDIDHQRWVQVNWSAIRFKRCQRCLSSIKRGAYLPDRKLWYCEFCNANGRVQNDRRLVIYGETRPVVQRESFLKNNVQLMPQQAKIVGEILEKTGNHHGIQAVTGAGKTEMTMALIAQRLAQGERVAYVSPRIEVLKEVSERFSGVFTVEHVLLYAEGDQYRYTQLVCLTANQLVHFPEQFDYLVFDECDAYPFNGATPLLQYVERSLRPQGKYLLLTATVTPQLAYWARKKRVIWHVLNRRYHGHPLPNLEIVPAKKWRKKLPERCVELLCNQNEGRLVLVFVPEREILPEIFDLVQVLVGQTKRIETIYAEDPKRDEKFKALQAGKFDIMITTTLLERGVNLGALDVVILGAEAPIFTTETLIQIAGRCGRSQADPSGTVLVCVTEKSRHVVKAKKRIARLNQ